ncbi:hypothetical protein SB861_37900 [Paraburkholderia sp. SIMBA_049]
MTKPIFVFGSNEAGRHGAGAALEAYKKHGARWGMSYGMHGSSFAIPTKDVNIETLPLERIQDYVTGFLAYAHGQRRVMTFKVTRIGCGLAGLKDEDIAPMFFTAPSNCQFDTAWKDYLVEGTQFWGTF